MSNMIPQLSWTRRPHLADLEAILPTGRYRIVSGGRAGYDLWWINYEPRSYDYLGWHPYEDVAQKAAADHVGDSE